MTTATPTMCRLDVLLFSVLRQQIGEERLTVQLGTPATGADLLDVLAAQYPVVADYRGVLRLAVNQEYVPDGVELHDGDEVALITPVSGG